MKRLLLIFAFCLFTLPAAAQSLQKICVQTQTLSGGATRFSCQDVTTAAPFPVGISAGSATVGGVFIAPTATAANGIAPVVSGSAENNHVLKATPGNLYSVYATNLTGTAGFLEVFDATTAPVDGAVTPVDCVPLPGNTTASLNYAPGPPGVFVNGIVAVVSSANTCFTKTTGVITAFIHGTVQ